MTDQNNLKAFILSLIWKIESAILMLVIILLSLNNPRLNFLEITILSLFVVFSYQILGVIWKTYLFVLQIILDKVLGVFGGKLLNHFLESGMTEFIAFHNSIWLKLIRL